MADYSFTAANVTLSSGPQPVDYIAGATITAGQAVYLDTSDNRVKLADADAIATAAAIGVAAHGASTGQPLKVYGPGSVVAFGGGFTAGVAVYVSPTAGGLCPVADVLSGDSPTIVGLPRSTSLVKIICEASGITI